MKKKIVTVRLIGLVRLVTIEGSTYFSKIFNSMKTLKSDSHLTKICFICFYESPLKMMKNTFYFILKALFVLKIFKFLS